jgi:site-specific DNA-cytosine methylase
MKYYHTMKLLELFSGTHSVGKVAKEEGYYITSVDRDLDSHCPFGSEYRSNVHIKTDIMTLDYKQWTPGEFDVITASPVCLWWSHLRKSWLGRSCKKIRPDGKPITLQDLDDDIENFGIPMVDKVFEIIDYLKPKYFWIENPQTGRMKDYISPLIPFYDVDYCMYGLPYKKRTRIWTNIERFTPKKCDKTCGFIIKDDEKKIEIHKFNLGNLSHQKKCKHILGQSGISQTSKLERYRVPYKLIKDLLKGCV